MNICHPSKPLAEWLHIRKLPSCMQATMHAEMDAINQIIASLPDEEKDTALHRHCFTAAEAL